MYRVLCADDLDVDYGNACCAVIGSCCLLDASCCCLLRTAVRTTRYCFISVNKRLNINITLILRVKCISQRAPSAYLGRI